MKVLVFGPSGSGKTYVSHALQKLGINAFDADDMEGLFAWFKDSEEVAPPESAEEAGTGQYAFLWSKKFLSNFLDKFEDVYVFGGSGNVFSVMDLFDKVYFLQVEPQLQRERILERSRKDPGMDINNGEIVIWGDWFEEVAAQQNIPFIDATQTPEAIFAIISG